MDHDPEHTVRATLEPHHSKIRGAILDGFAEVQAVDQYRRENDLGPRLYPRTVTNDIFDAVARRASSTFVGVPGVRVLHETQTVKFCFDDKVLLRFKKGDESHLGRNIQTQASLAFVDPQQDLPGMPSEAVKVEVLYETNVIGNEIEKVLVVARDGNRLLWFYEIGDDADSATGTVIPMPLAPAPDDDDMPMVKPKVGPKKADRKE